MPDGPTDETASLVSDEQLQSITVGERKPHNASVTLVEYDPAWPALYEREAVRIRGALGATVVRLEHTGSTSVPGLAAKPVIDMTLTVPDSADEAAYIPRLEAAGYVLRIREPHWHEHRLLMGPDTVAHLHVFSVGSVELDRMVGFRDWLRMHEEDRAPTRDAIGASIRNNTPYDIVYRTVHPTTGEVKWIRALGGADYAADGTPTHFDGVTVDVSEQKLDQQRLAQLNKQLREHDRRKDEFIATLSHELRNPLAPIRAAAKVIASPQAAPTQVRLAQLIVERQVTHMALLLDDLLDIARITQGKLQLKKETLSLIPVIDAAIEAVRPTLEGKNQQLEVSLPAETILLDADHLRLSQVISNLLMNAAKYSDPGGHIKLKCNVLCDTLELSIKDDGIGIAPEWMPEIFEMFSQVSSVAGRSEGGLGIGLALVKGIAEMHGGSVEARSRGLGFGSEFIVRLPLAARPQVASRFGADPEQAPPARRRILVADDNRDAAESLAMLLEMAGHEVRVAHLGRAALALAQVFRPDTALLDIGMPDLSGYEVAQSLRAEPWAANIRLIALTGWGQDSDRRRALEAGFDHHLIKPVDPDQLAGLIAS